MVSETILGDISILFQMVMLFFCLVSSVVLIKESNRSLASVFLTFCFAIYLLDEVYWLTYTLLRPDVRMPFAANEIGEASVFLLFASTLRAAIRLPYAASLKCTIGIILFSLCNTILWIIWSGEYIQDIMIGITFTYFLYTILSAIEFRQALKRYMWIVLTLCSTLIIILQISTILSEGNIKNTIDLSAYILMLALVIFIGVIFFSSWKKKSPEVLLCQNYLLFGCILTVKYMSDGIWYIIFQLMETIAFAFLYLSVRKAVGKE